jgi:hypothetical protein
MGNKFVTNKPQTTLEDTRERGKQYILEFQALPKDDQIDYLAHLMYVKIYVDPYGYPNGMPTWDELPLIDSGHSLGVDKSRYIDAASIVHKMLTWKLNNDTNT